VSSDAIKASLNCVHISLHFKLEVTDLVFGSSIVVLCGRARSPIDDVNNDPVVNVQNDEGP